MAPLIAAGRNGGSVSRVVRAIAVGLFALAVVTGCSPEASRTQGAGLGADPGNSRLPIELHGDRRENNPNYDVPQRGRVPSDSRGVPGWWAS
jgi:hypothetical protein